MRTQFIQTSSPKKALAECPWAAKLIKVEGGYRCFESVSDYETWRKQK